ncbi:MAG: DUF1592 domain-containing protein [Planctomycetota bacterium]
MLKTNRILALSSVTIIASLITFVMISTQPHAMTRSTYTALAIDLPPVPAAIATLLETNCIECHSGEKPKAGLDLEIVLEDGPHAELEDWRLIERVISSGEMPPEDEPAPTSSLREEVTTQIQNWTREILRSLPEKPGSVATRRLSRTELRNSIRDLTGVEIDIHRHLPADPSSDGFDNQGGSVSPTFIERLFRIAEEVSLSAVIRTEENSNLSSLYPVDLFTLTGSGRVFSDSAFFSSQGSASSDHFFPRTGSYHIHIKGWGQQAGDQPVRFRIQVGDQKSQVIQFPETRNLPGIRTIKGHFSSGIQTIRASFINDYYKPDHPDPDQRDRNAALVSFTVEGPEEGLEPTSFQKSALAGTGTATERLARGIKNWLPLFWREPVSTSQQLKLIEAAKTAAFDPESAESLLRSALITALVSPRFILRIEKDPTTAISGTIRNLTGYELATRLSYFLWSTTPDRALLDAAERGELDTKEGLLAQTRRLLSDARSRSLATDFATQWLRIRDLADRKPDGKIFPLFDQRLLSSMKAETIHFFDHVLRHRLPLDDLINASYTFSNQRLARHYGFKGVRGNKMQRVEIQHPRGGGLLSQGSILLATSTHQRTSPVLRGKWLLEVLLDAAPPPPPPGAGALPLPGEAGADLPLRQQLKLHRREPSCSICHRRMDALGFAMEKFDATGRYREEDVDDRGELPDGSILDGLDDLRLTVSKSTGFRRSIASQLLTYALGRGLVDDDASAVARLLQKLETEPTIPALIEEIVLLEAFRRRWVH